MSKWHSLLEVFQFPLKLLFFGTFLLGVGSIALNQNITFLWHIENQTLLILFELIRYVGASIIHLFPLLVYVHILSHKYESSVTTIIGVLSYVLVHVTMAFYVNPNLPSYFYHSIFGVSSIDFNQITSILTLIRMPYNLGILGFILSYFITHYCYLISRRYSIFGIFSFIDHDSVAGILTCIFSIACGVGLGYVWPFVLNGVNLFNQMIANDITNPINLFLYGIIERISTISGLGDIPRQIFWFSDMGGSWLNSVGQKFSGDVAIWTAQRQEGMSILTTGTFITPYYIINLFIIPAYYISIYKLCSDAQDRRRYIGFIILAVLLSVLCGNPMPAEILMLILSPMLFACYMVIIGLLYSFLQMFHIVVGYSFNEMLLLANPGSGLDLLQYMRSSYIAENVYKLIFVGLIVGIIFYFLTKVYFEKYSFGFFQVVNKDKVCETIVTHLGGLDNILEVHSTPDKLNVRYVNQDLINYEELKKLGAYMMLESKMGFLFRIGNISTIVRDYILKKKQEQTVETISK